MRPLGRGRTISKGRTGLIGLVATVLACGLLLTPAAWAAIDTRTVNSTLDPGDGSCSTNGCTLREAITELNADNDTVDQDQIHIMFSSIFSSTITLGSGLPTIDEPLSIDSTGLVSPTVSGNGIARPFFIDTAAGDDVLISGLKIDSGVATSAAGGGAIYAQDADVAISGSTISNSDAADGGGGVSVAVGSLTVENSTLIANASTLGSGGGVRGTNGANITIRGSTLNGNHADGTSANGGGIYVFFGGSLAINRSTISGNYSQSSGGGVLVSSTATTIQDTTISGNFTQAAGANGGGIYANGTDPVLLNTIVANNAAAGTGPDLEGALVDDDFRLAYSLVEDTSSAPIVHTVMGSNILDQDPALGALQGNGGPTFTHLPGVTSPVLDKGRTDESTDQRGVSRPNDFANIDDRAGGDAAEIGSVEIQIAPPTFTSTSPASPSSDDTPTIFGAAQDGTVRLYTGPTCTPALQTGASTADEVFSTSGMTVSPVTHNATTTFYGRIDTTYGTSVCSSGVFPNTISYTHADPPPPPPSPPSPPGVTGSPAGSCAGNPATHTGSAGNDVINGSPGLDVVAALGGNDTVRGLGGNDVVCGGGGNDLIVGGGGKDTLRGQAGKDTLKGGAKKDKLIGGGGKDILIGGGATDVLNGGPGADVQRQ